MKDGLVTHSRRRQLPLVGVARYEVDDARVGEKVRELVEAGAKVIGPKPEKSPSLANYPACDAEVAKIADEVWGIESGERKFGKGTVFAGNRGSTPRQAEPKARLPSGERRRSAGVHPSRDGIGRYLFRLESTAFPDDFRLRFPHRGPPAGTLGRGDRHDAARADCGASLTAARS